jgi:hypothetical protein
VVLRQKRRSSVHRPFVVCQPVRAHGFWPCGIFLSTPTVTSPCRTFRPARRRDGGDARWQTFLTASPAGSIQAELEFVDPIVTSSIASGAGVTPSKSATSRRQGKTGAPDPPDEPTASTRRSQDRGIVIAVAPVAPPKDFSAGTVLERQSRSCCVRLPISRPLMAFAKPKIGGKEIEIATAFYTSGERKRDPQVPAMLASLVTNDNPDILATAYAPPAPDYAKPVPFQLCCEPECHSAAASSRR